MKKLLFTLFIFHFFLIFNLKGLNGSILRMVGPEDVGGAFKKIIEDFEKINPDIEIKYIAGPWSTDERENIYIRSFLTHDPIEIVYMDVTWVPKFAKNSWIIPLDRWFRKDMRDKFLKASIDAGTYNGHIYRVPLTSDVGMLYFRKDIVKTPPKTWKDLEEACKRLSDPKRHFCIVFQGMQYEGLVCNFFEYFWGVGGKNLNRKNLDKITQALKFMKNLLDRGWAPKSVLSFQEQHSLAFFCQGKAIFMRNWPYAWQILQKSKLKGKVGIAPLIKRDGFGSHGVFGGWGFGIANGTKNREDAWKFINFATSVRSQKIIHKIRGLVPSRKSLFFDPYILKNSPHYRELYKIIDKAKVRPKISNYPVLSDVIKRHVSAVLSGIEKEEDAAKYIINAAEILEKGVKKNYLKRITSDEELKKVTLNTAIFTSISVPLELLLGILIALFLNLDIKGKRILKISVIVPWILPTAVMAMSWQWMFNNPFGVINDILVRVKILKEPFDWLCSTKGAMFASIFADVWKTTPFFVIILYAGLRSIPKELSESIYLDGAGSLSKFFYLTLPMLLPFIRVGLIFRMIHAAGIFDLIWVLTKGGPADSTKTVAIYIYELAFRYNDLYYAVFLTVLFAISLILISFLIVKATTLSYEKIR